MKELEEFAFSPRGAPPSSRYDWDKLCNGRIFRAEHGEDFDATPRAFESALRAQSQVRRDKGLKNRYVRVKRLDAENAVVFQFYDNEERWKTDPRNFEAVANGKAKPIKSRRDESANGSAARSSADRMQERRRELRESGVLS